MKRSSNIPARIVLMASLLLGACGVGPTEEDINNSLEQALQSANGNWTGTSTNPSGALTLSFSLNQAANGSLTGSGTMKETSAPSAVPITIAGTFQRPVLTLTFSGMVYEGTAVQGTFQGNYTTIGGVLSNLQLTGTGYSKTVVVLLQEQ
ncbi:MAG: hypothetical protein H0W42_03160 [Gemmatimonadaceae bacterium]|nr:hypothetical protein [Gemmatimonadaceae bacterium]